MNNFVPINFTTWMEWTNALEDINYPDSLKKTQKITWTFLYLLKKLSV